MANITISKVAVNDLGDDESGIFAPRPVLFKLNKANQFLEIKREDCESGLHLTDMGS
jgi:hypothetical protein